MLPSYLILENGAIFQGFSPARQQNRTFHGEVVFNTGMMGYVEALTDPSYKGQILTFTYPLIGNYGVPNRKFWESKKIYVSGVAVSEACENWSHYQGAKSLLQWLKEQKVPAIIGIDTRALTKTLRKSGVMLGVVTDEKRRIKKFYDPNQENLAAQVSIAQKRIYGRGKKKIILVDCGLKESILRNLRQFPIAIERVPYNYDYSRENFSGVIVSNGPGDPTKCRETIAVLKKIMQKKKPIFGICLGTQIMALAASAKTYKLPYGHRGQNQPCLDLKTKKCYITSQNHGYAIKEKTLPAEWQITFKNLNDGSVEGIKHKNLPFFAVQFHPEASPGPTDTKWMFEKFYKLI